MMKNKGTKKLFIIFFLELLLLMLFQTTALAMSSKAEKVITPSNLKEWEDGATVMKKVSGKEENFQVEVTADTTGLEENYYTVYIYDDTKRNIKAYDGIRFSFNNESDVELKINLTLSINSKLSVMMTDASFAILEDSDQENIKVLSTTYGTLSIPAHFNGTVCIPFSQLYNEEGEQVSLGTIQSWGITTIMSEDQLNAYTIGNIAFLEGSVAAMKDSLYLIAMSGDNEIALPEAGSVLKQYQASVFDLEGNEVDSKVSFFLKDKLEGASVTEDGKLEIQSSCAISEITLYAKTNESVNAGEVVIALKQDNQETQTMGVPKVEAVNKITSTAYTNLIKSVIWFRIFCVMIVILIETIFIDWFSEAGANYLIMKKRLYKILSEQEEEEEP